MNRRMNHRIRVFVALCFALYLLSLALPLLIRAPSSTAEDGSCGQGWEGHYRVLFPVAGENLKAATTALREADFDDVLSRDKATVSISNFNGLEQVPLSRLEERLPAMDPRWDPFLRNVEKLFRAGSGGEYEVVYVASRAPLGEFRDRVSAALEGVEGADGWIIAEAGQSVLGVFLLGFIAVAAVVVVGAGRTRYLAAGGAVPWLGTVTVGGAGTFIAASVIYFAWVGFADTGRRYLDHRLQYGRWNGGGRELRRSLILLALVWAVVLAAYPGLSLSALMPIAGSGVGLAAFSGLAVAHALYKRARQDHRLFVPVSLRPFKPVIPAFLPRLTTAVWVAVLVFGVPYLSHLLPSGGTPAAPAPVPLEGRNEIDFESLHALRDGTPRGVVNIADFVAHRAYQEGFAYGVEYGLPEEGATVELSRFTGDNGTTVREPEVMLRYDEAWLDRTLAPDSSNLGALLANGDTPSGVVRTGKPGVYSVTTHPARYSLQALLAFSPFLALGLRRTPADRNGVPFAVLGRKRQAV